MRINIVVISLYIYICFSFVYSGITVNVIVEAKNNYLFH